ncbi:hypothetical protein ACFW3Z_19850 [Nocardiopsis alba]|uniref:hypothetical protein n=1 Tax=Nocardiopsis alba TaxID=53437 RepID=UPI0033AC20EB
MPPRRASFDPSGPPPRVGGAVAALVVAMLTLVVPILGFSMGLWFFIVLANVPGIVMGVMALKRVPDTEAVERYIRYTWGCTFAYTALYVVFAIPVLVLTFFILLLGI